MTSNWLIFILLYLVIVIPSNYLFILINAQFSTLKIQNYQSNNCKGNDDVYEIPIGTCLGNQGGELSQLTSCDGIYYSVSYWSTNSSNCDDMPKPEMITQVELGICHVQENSIIASCH